MKAFVERWAAHTGADSVQVVDAADDARLIAEALAAGEIEPVSGGRYHARSYFKDTARSEERTFVATSNPADKGAFNNWVHADEIRPVVEGLMANASRG
jgi:phosphoenolpyruvate carboxykinase (GTP)